jgi:prepilin-type N-terminal cleavage/methylation domain-containing protein
MKCKGFTLVEMLVVISIIALLASLSAPALWAAKERAKETRSLNNMRQIHVALMLYCDSQPEDGPLGLGLPPQFFALIVAHKIPKALTRTGGSTWKSPTQDPLYTWMPPNLDTDTSGLMPRWKQHLRMTQNNPVFLLDETYPGTNTPGAFSMKKATGMYFDGHIEKRRTRGSLSQYELWENAQ